MLIQVCNLSPGDEVVTGRYNGILSNVKNSEDGSILLEFENGGQEWLESNRIVVKKDKFSSFFTPDPVQ